MSAFRIVYSLLKVPRLFASLLLFPIIGALIIVAIQLVFTASALTQISSVKNLDVEDNIDPNWNALRIVLFSDPYPLEQAPVLCIWKKENGVETYPSEQCRPDRLDVALNVSPDVEIDYQKYLDMIKGNALRLHVCSDCKPDLRIINPADKPQIKISSIYGLMLYQLIIRDEEKESAIKEIRKEINRYRKGLGSVEINLASLKRPINLSSIDISLAATLNITALAVIALWLGLKAHRKVLEYFSKSGALLPMVAATGKKPFYRALWIITGLRVFSFLGASVPLLLITLVKSYSISDMQLIDVSSSYFAVWIIALFAGLSLATIIASMADLKARHELLSIAYKLIPLFLSIFGVMIWSVTFFGTGELSGILRSAIAAIPVIGLGPLIFSQVIQLPSLVLLIHLLLSIAGCYYLLNKNTHWFAAHLEEI